MKFKVYSTDGTKSSEKEFSQFPQLEEGKGINALRSVIIAYQANIRQGNAHTKTRAEVRGGGKKPYRQKGTGYARAGSKRSPIFVGGGTVFGPRKRSYTQKINSKIKNLALKRALVERTEDIDVIEQFHVSAPKTKEFNSILNNIHNNGSVLIIDEQFEDTAVLAARNIERVHICDAASVNAWDLSRFDKVLFSEKGLNKVLERANKS